MKLLSLTTALAVTATNAFAGSVAFVDPVVPEMVVEETGSMGGSGLWLIPLIAIALIFLVMKDSGGTDGGECLDCQTPS